jgi:hypothetical protein
MKTLLTATAIIFSMTAAGNAADAPRASDVLSGGAIFGYTSSSAECEFINFGTTNVTPLSQEIFIDGSTSQFSSASTCANGTAIVPNQTCIIYTTSTLYYYATSCKVTFNGPATNVRGALQILDSNYNILAEVELR